MKKLIFVSLLSTIILQSCKSGGSGNTSAELPSNFVTDKIVANAEDLQQLITKKDVGEIVGIDSSKITAFTENPDLSIAASMLLFSWDNGQKINIGAGSEEQKINGSSSIAIGRLMRLSTSEFEKRYTTSTKEELAADINDIVKDEGIDTDIAIWEAKEIAKNAKIQQFEKLSNVGTAAYWEMPVQALHVLAKDIAFTVSTNLNSSELENKQRAIAVANFLLNK